jgi:hypothetical protein
MRVCARRASTESEPALMRPARTRESILCGPTLAVLEVSVRRGTLLRVCTRRTPPDRLAPHSTRSLKR